MYSNAIPYLKINKLFGIKYFILLMKIFEKQCTKLY